MRQGLMAKMASSDGLSRFSPESPCPLQKTPPNSGVHTTLTALIVLPTSVGIRKDFLCCLVLSKASGGTGRFYLIRSWSFHWLNLVALNLHAVLVLIKKRILSQESPFMGELA